MARDVVLCVEEICVDGVVGLGSCCKRTAVSWERDVNAYLESNKYGIRVKLSSNKGKDGRVFHSLHAIGKEPDATTEVVESEGKADDYDASLERLVERLDMEMDPSFSLLEQLRIYNYLKDLQLYRRLYGSFSNNDKEEIA